MWKKILLWSLAVILVIFGLLGWYVWNNITGSKESITADLEPSVLYESRCAICHGGAVSEAPSIEALKLLPKDRIVKALKTGVMRNQASTLSDDQHLALAKFISEVDESELASTTTIGLCLDESLESLQGFPQIDNWGLGLENKRYYNQPGLEIDAENVDQLSLSWAFAFPNASRARVQPTISGNTIFTASQVGTIYALDRQTGCTKWTFQADEEIRSALVIGRDSLGAPNRLYFGDFAANLYSLDLTTRKLLWKKRIDEHPTATITGTLSLYENRLYVPVSSSEVLNAVDENYECCTFRGSVVALEKESGEMIWKAYSIADEAKPFDTNSVGTPIWAPSGAPIWTGVTIDTKRRRIYVGTGENYTRPASKTSDAILAFDMDNGEMLWAQQTIPKDAWNGACALPFNNANCPEDNGPDADFGAPPILVNSNGKDLLLAGQKSGHAYALDPDKNGAIVWQQLVGRGGTMGGVHWGMATNEKTLYVPINDRGLYDLNENKPKSPGMHALNVADGKVLWSTIEEDRCPPLTLRGCGPGISAAITLTPEVVFGGTLDGFMKAYATSDGRELWSYDTKRDYDAINGVKAFGGAIDSDGPVIVDDQLFITSGYAKFSEKEGNVLLAFSLSR